MADNLQIIGANEDNFVFERAFIAQADGKLQPRAILGGVECNISTRPGPLASGLALCEPMDPKLVNDWPLYVDVATPSGQPSRRWRMTRHPAIVAAARRFAALLQSGQLRAGQTL